MQSKYSHLGHGALSVLCGQILSVILTGTGVVNQLLSTKHQANLAGTQAVSCYILLGIIYTAVFMRNKQPSALLHAATKRWHVYFVAAGFDVLASLFAVWSYAHSPLMVVTLLSASSAPAAMFLNLMFLRTRFKPAHYVGISICIGTILAYCISAGLKAADLAAVKGIIQPILSAVFYAISNTIQERCVRSHGHTEFLSFLGIFGTLWSLAIYCTFLTDEYRFLCTKWSDVQPYLAVYAVLIVAFYTGIPLFMKMTSAVFFNMSILTANFYAAMASIFLPPNTVKWELYVYLALLTLGLVIYNAQCPESDEQQLDSDTSLLPTMLDATERDNGNIIVSKRI